MFVGVCSWNVVFSLLTRDEVRLGLSLCSDQHPQNTDESIQRL